MQSGTQQARFTAAYVFVMLFSVLLWGHCGVLALGQTRLKHAQILEYVAIYLFFLWMVTTAFIQHSKCFISIFEMNEGTLEKVFEDYFVNNATAKEQLMREVSLEDHPWLKWLSVLALIPMMSTWFVCIGSTVSHVKVMASINADNHHCLKLHDRAIQIIALPTAYGLMSFCALTRILSIMTNAFSTEALTLKTFEERAKVTLMFYDAHYLTADLYEAWALYQFARLSLEVVAVRFRGMIISTGHDTAFTKAQHGDMSKLVVGIHNSVQKLTMQGIWSFVMVCAVESIYGLLHPILLQKTLISNSGWYKSLYDSVKGADVEIHAGFVGMGLVASSAAIGNILQVEQSLHHELRAFKPFWKFWATKVLVTFAFLQQALFYLPMPVFRDLSDLQTRLVYSTAMCYECFLVSLLHLYSWKPDEEWYNTNEPGGVVELAMVPHHDHDGPGVNPLNIDFPRA